MDELWSLAPFCESWDDEPANSQGASSRGIGLTLRHRPTGLLVMGTIAARFCSKVEMQRDKRELRDRLTRELENAVARFERLSHG